MPGPNDGDVRVVVTMDASSFSAATDGVIRKTRRIGEVAKEASAHTVSAMQANSGALRTMEGAIPLRAAEKFLSMLPGIGPALVAAFPVVGALALVNVLARGIEHLATFVKKSKEAEEKFRLSFQEMGNAARLANDELEKTNIAIENQIAKLEHKPQNALAAELIEARIRADQLAMAAQTATDKVKALLDANLKNGLMRFATGDGTSPDLFGTMNSYMQQYRDAQQAAADARYGGDTKGAEAADKRAREIADSAINRYRSEMKTRTGTVTSSMDSGSGGSFDLQQSYAEANGNQDTNLNALRGGIGYFQNENNRAMEAAQNAVDTKKLKDAENAAAAARAAKQHEAERIQALRTSFSEELSNAKQNHKMNLQEEGDFWHQKIALVKGTSKEAEGLRRDIDKTLSEITGKERGVLEKAAEKSTSGIKLESPWDGANRTGEHVKAEVAAAREMATSAAQSAAAYDEGILKLQQMNGQISGLEESQRLVAVHAKEYTDQLKAWQEYRDFWQKAPTGEGKAHLDEADKAMQKLSLENSLQQMQDRMAMLNQTGLGALQLSLAEYVQSSQNSAQQVRSLWTSTWGSINEQFVKMMTERHHGTWARDWRNVGSGIFKNVAATGLQRAEGALFKGLVKPDGTASNPLHVIIAGAKGVASQIGGGVSDAAKGTGGFFAKALGTFGSLLGFADGGQVPGPGVPIMVGERGPEIFTPGSNGSIIPNHALGGVTHHWNIDAKGSSDPAAVEAAAHRAIMKAAPALVAASMQSHKEHQARVPLSRRS